MIVMAPEDLRDQAGMERAFRRYFADVREQCPGTLNAMLEPRLVAWDFREKTVTLAVDTRPWMANPGGIVHGGVTAACLDLVMGLLCRYFSGGRMTRTVHQDVDYLRAAKIGKTLCIRAESIKLGSSLCFTRGTVWAEGDPERPLASAVGCYAVDPAGGAST